MYLVGQIPKNVSLRLFEQELNRHGIQYRLEDAQDCWQLYVQDSSQLSAVQEFMAAYLQQVNQQQATGLSWSNLKRTPIILMVLMLVAAGALLSGLGSDNRDWFYIADINFETRTWSLYGGLALIWHSLSPIFLHFSVEHLAFNCLMFWYLGSHFERQAGSMLTALFVILTALVSNYAQLIYSGPLFGGLSAVVYGLLAFLYAYQQWIKHLAIPKGLFVFSAIWLLLGFTDIFIWLGLGSMANVAHVSGAICGFLFFIFYKLVSLFYENR